MIRVRKKQPRVIYPGSTIPQNYSEDSIKGFLLWDIKSKNDWTVDFHSVAHKHHGGQNDLSRTKSCKSH